MEQTVVNPQGQMVRSETFIDQPGETDRRVQRDLAGHAAEGLGRERDVVAP